MVAVALNLTPLMLLLVGLEAVVVESTLLVLVLAAFLVKVLLEVMGTLVVHLPLALLAGVAVLEPQVATHLLVLAVTVALV